MNNEKIRFLTRTAILLTLALVFQMGGLPQPVTGPVINAILYLAVILVGMSSGIVVGTFTPVLAFMRGILPPPLGPMVPFIALGNALLCILFGLLDQSNRYLAIVVASIGKFLLLASAARFIVDIPAPAAEMMALPQLLTALGGGAVAVVLASALKKTGFDRFASAQSLKAKEAAGSTRSK